MRYDDCENPNCTDCGACSLSNYGQDCHGMPVNKLAFHRKKAGLTQKQLADMVGCAQSRIAQYEHDRPIENMTLGTAVKIAKAVNVNAEDLL